MQVQGEARDHRFRLGDVIAPRNEPQYRLATVLADYWYRRSEHVPSAALVEILAAFDVTEGNARQAMRRLVQRGVFVMSKSGRNTSYGFPDRTPQEIDDRIRTLIGYHSPRPWDQLWTVATFSVPESQRDVRRSLRTRLTGLGFGLLQDAVWISPRDHIADAQAVFEQYNVDGGHVFRARHHARDFDETALIEAFDLSQIESEYRSFIEKHSAPDAGVANPMVERTLLMFDWQTLRIADPDLPEVLLPSDWPRAEAYRVFAQAYTDLGPAAEQQFRQLLGKYDPQLAELATHHIP